MVSGVQADPTRNVVEGPAASTDKIAETANGVFEDTADGMVVVSSMSIAAAKEMELSKAFVDLLRSRMASDKRRCFEKARERRERVEVKDNLIYHGNRWVIPQDPALKLRIQCQNHDSKVAGHSGQLKETDNA
jgi:hypothetical protein